MENNLLECEGPFHCITPPDNINYSTKEWDILKTRPLSSLNIRPWQICFRNNGNWCISKSNLDDKKIYISLGTSVYDIKYTNYILTRYFFSGELVDLDLFTIVLFYSYRYCGDKLKYFKQHIQARLNGVVQVFSKRYPIYFLHSDYKNCCILSPVCKYLKECVNICEIMPIIYWLLTQVYSLKADVKFLDYYKYIWYRVKIIQKFYASSNLVRFNLMCRAQCLCSQMLIVKDKVIFNDTISNIQEVGSSTEFLKIYIPLDTPFDYKHYTVVERKIFDSEFFKPFSMEVPTNQQEFLLFRRIILDSLEGYGLSHKVTRRDWHLRSLNNDTNYDNVNSHNAIWYKNSIPTFDHYRNTILDGHYNDSLYQEKNNYWSDKKNFCKTTNPYKDIECCNVLISPKTYRPASFCKDLYWKLDWKRTMWQTNDGKPFISFFNMLTNYCKNSRKCNVATTPKFYYYLGSSSRGKHLSRIDRGELKEGYQLNREYWSEDDQEEYKYPINHVLPSEWPTAEDLLVYTIHNLGAMRIDLETGNFKTRVPFPYILSQYYVEYVSHTLELLKTLASNNNHSWSNVLEILLATEYKDNRYLTEGIDCQLYTQK